MVADVTVSASDEDFHVGMVGCEMVELVELGELGELGNWGGYSFSTISISAKPRSTSRLLSNWFW